MKLTEVTGYNSRTATILKESYQDLTETQIVYLNRWEKELWPLVEQYTKIAEAQLTKDQIMSIFQSAEETAMASGDNKTALGKAGGAAAGAVKMSADVAKQVKAKIDELGRMVKNAGPVKNADAKFNELKKQITANNSDSKIVQGIEKISNWAKENPGKASIAVGILTAMAAFASGPAGGLAAGMILRQTKGLLQGEDLSTATGGALKAAALGALAGMSFEYISDLVADNIANATDADLMNQLEAFDNAAKADALAGVSAEYGGLVDQLDGATNLSMSGSVNRFFYDYDVIMTAEQMAQFDALENQLSGMKTFSEEWYKKTAEFHDFMGNIQADPMQDSLKAAQAALEAAQEVEASVEDLEAAGIFDKIDNLEQFIQTAEQVNPAIGAAAQGAVTAAEKQEKAAQKAQQPEQGELDLQGGENPKSESLSMEERFELFLMEADPAQGELPLDNPNSIGAKAKRGLGNLAAKAKAGVAGAASKAAGAVKQGAKDLGNKVTANKLMKAWKAAGEPTDAGSIANILADAGMTNDQIKSLGQSASIEEPLVPNAQSSAQTDAPADKNAQSSAQTVAKQGTIKKGATKEVNGKSYEWAGALWVDTATKKPISIQAAMDMGLGHPKLDPIIAAAQKDPKLKKAILQTISAKGVKAGTSAAKAAADAGVKGTEPAPVAKA